MKALNVECCQLWHDLKGLNEAWLGTSNVELRKHLEFTLCSWAERNGSCAFLLAFNISLVLVYIMYEMLLGFAGAHCPSFF